MSSTQIFLAGLIISVFSLAFSIIIALIAYSVRRNIDGRIDEICRDIKDMQKELIEKRHKLRNELQAEMLEEGKERIAADRELEARVTRRLERLENGKK